MREIMILSLKITKPFKCSLFSFWYLYDMTLSLKCSGQLFWWRIFSTAKRLDFFYNFIILLPQMKVSPSTLRSEGIKQWPCSVHNDPEAYTMTLQCTQWPCSLRNDPAAYTMTLQLTQWPCSAPGSLWDMSDSTNLGPLFFSTSLSIKSFFA